MPNNNHQFSEEARGKKNEMHEVLKIVVGREEGIGAMIVLHIYILFPLQLLHKYTSYVTQL